MSKRIEGNLFFSRAYPLRLSVFFSFTSKTQTIHCPFLTLVVAVHHDTFTWSPLRLRGLSTVSPALCSLTNPVFPVPLFSCFASPPCGFSPISPQNHHDQAKPPTTSYFEWPIPLFFTGLIRMGLSCSPSHFRTALVPPSLVRGSSAPHIIDSLTLSTSVLGPPPAPSGRPHKRHGRQVIVLIVHRRRFHSSLPPSLTVSPTLC